MWGYQNVTLWVPNIGTIISSGRFWREKSFVLPRLRVHYWQIGLAKSYKILVQPMNAWETRMSSEIIFVYAILCYFRAVIVPRDVWGHRRRKLLGRAGRGPPNFLPLWAANVSDPPTFGHLIRPNKFPICVLRDEFFSDERVALTNHCGYKRPLNSSTARPGDFTWK